MVINGARDPLAMGDDNYGRLCLELKYFLSAATSLPYRPTHLVASQITKADAFVAAIDVMINAQNLMRQSTKHVEGAYKLLLKKLRWMRDILPTLTPGDNSILIPFGLDKPIERNYEELKNYADAADAYWQTVALDPLYAPHAAGCNELAGLIADFEAKRMNQVSLSNTYSAAQNAKDLARAAHHIDERAIFGHYAAYYPDGQDLYWDQTPWGRATGEGGGTSPEIGVPENFVVVIDGEDVRISWDAVEGAEEYQLVHTEFPPLYTGLYDGVATEFVHVNPIGGTHYYRVRAKVGDSYGEYTAGVSVVVVGVKPEPPTNLLLELVGNKIKATFQSPPSSPDGFNAYVAHVPIGNPAPEMPAEAYYEELFVLSFTISPLQIGETYYAWVTSVDDGEESDPCGPESVDV